MKSRSPMAAAAALVGLVMAGLCSPAHAKVTDTFVAQGDTIYEQTVPGITGLIIIGLKTEHPWSRSIVFHDANGVQLEVNKVNGAYTTSEAMVVSPVRMNDTVTVEFWKAKLLGINQKVYQKTFNTNSLVGQMVTFQWLEGKGDTIDSQLPPPGGSRSFKTPDGDLIYLYNENGTPGRVQITFTTPSNITWWKSIKVFENTGQAVEIQRQDGRNLTANINVPRSRFDSTIKIEYWKAKAFGIPTKVYTQVYDADSFNGRLIALNWYKD